MSKRVKELFLFDIYIAILKIEKTLSKFENAQQLLYDFNAWDSVIREFEIMGEATKHLLESNMLEKENRVVVDFRNLLIHNYFGIGADEVWDVAKCDIPIFKKDILDKINLVDKNLKANLTEAYIEQNIYLDFIVKELKTLSIEELL